MSIADCSGCSSKICSTGTATYSSANHDIEGRDEAASGPSVTLRSDFGLWLDSGLTGPTKRSSESDLNLAGHSPARRPEAGSPMCGKSHLRPGKLATVAPAVSLPCHENGSAEMFVTRSGRGRITAAYLDKQFARQEWLPIDSRPLQHFLAAAPACSSAQRRRLRLRH